MRAKIQGVKAKIPESRLVTFFLFLLFTLFLNTACAAPEEPAERTIRPVRVITASLEEQQGTILMTGEVLSGETRHISFLVSGRIDELFVQKEDVINPDTLLGKVNDLDYQRASQGAQANLQAAQANLNKAVTGATREELLEMELQLKKAREAYAYADQQLERLRNLYQAGGISQADLDRTIMETAAAEASYQQAEARYQQLLNGTRSEDISALAAVRDAAQAEVSHYATQVERTMLYAPHQGTVAELFYQQGEMYRQGTPFLTLNSRHHIVRVSASLQQRALINKGNRVKVFYDEGRTEGVITMVSTNPDPFTRTYRVEVELPDTPLTLGELVQVEFYTKGVLGTPLPMKAVLAGNPDYVYVIDDQTAKQVPVNLLELDGSIIWVTGLDQGQQVVVEGMHLLSHDETVRVVEEGEGP